MDYGLKISKVSQDVKTASKENLYISSKYPMFKISSQGTSTLSLYKTTISGNITAGQTTIPLTSSAGFHNGSFSSGTVPFAFVGPDKFTYTGISGNTLTGCSARSFSHLAGTSAVNGYTEFSVPHGFSYPPVHFIFVDGNSYSSSGNPLVATAIPVMYEEFQEIQLDGFVDVSSLYISVSLVPLNAPDTYIQGMTHDDYYFRYTIMLDSIITPYY